MTKEYSPFTPGVPVPLEFFVGRTQEIQKIISATKKAVELKTIERIFVMGERGIGKSSICNFASAVAEKNLNILGLHVYLGGVTTLEEMVRRVFERLLRDSIDKPWYGKIQEFFGNHIRQVDLFGVTVEFSASEQELSRAVSDFAPALRNLLTRITPDKKGILLILDDLNGLVSSDRFANWLKSLIDEIATAKNPLPLTILLVGLAERRHQLIENQPSLDRVFDLIVIDRFSKEETEEFYRRTFAKVNVTIKKDALDYLADLSGGYPVFMHELGDAVFKKDVDNNIDIEDARGGCIHGTLVIGDKYIEPKVLAAIKSTKYQHILEKMAFSSSYFTFTRKEATARLAVEEVKVFDNFLSKMKQLGVIREDKERGPGNYEFTSKLYWMFFWLQGWEKTQVRIK